MKRSELKLTQDNLVKALNDNILDRNENLLSFYQLLLSLENGYSIALDGAWGEGKTFFVKQLQMIINASNKYSEMDNDIKQQVYNALNIHQMFDSNLGNLYAIYYDSWLNDNDLDPILSFVYEITKQVDTKFFDEDCGLFDVLKVLVSHSKYGELVNIGSDLSPKNPLKIIETYHLLEGSIKDFLDSLLNERANRLVIFIDELDRCKPVFAVRLLEQIKHYFDDDRLIFVFSTNLKQLQHTIKMCYGNEFDSTRYLDRFFDLRIPLPKGNMENYYDSLEIGNLDHFSIVCTALIKEYSLGLREINKFLQQTKVCVYKELHKNRYNDFSDYNGIKFILQFVVPLLIVLKMTNENLYQEFIDGRNPRPLILLVNKDEFRYYTSKMLKEGESFSNRQKGTLVKIEDKVVQIYEAIFKPEETPKEIGTYLFDNSSRDFALTASGALSKYADYQL